MLKDGGHLLQSTPTIMQSTPKMMESTTANNAGVVFGKTTRFRLRRETLALTRGVLDKRILHKGLSSGKY